MLICPAQQIKEKKKLDLTNHAVWKRTGLRVVGVARLASCRHGSTDTLRGTPVSRQPPREQGLLLPSATRFSANKFSCHHLTLTVGIILYKRRSFFDNT